MKWSFLVLIGCIFLILLVSCATTPNAEFSTFRPYTYRSPENINDGLEVGSLEEVNIEQSLIEKAVNDIGRGRYGEVHSMLIFKDDKLVLEEYFKGHKYQWDGLGHHGELVVPAVALSH